MDLEEEPTTTTLLNQDNPDCNLNIGPYIHRYVYSSPLITETSFFNRKRPLLLIYRKSLVIKMKSCGVQFQWLYLQNNCT